MHWLPAQLCPLEPLEEDCRAAGETEKLGPSCWCPVCFMFWSDLSIRSWQLVSKQQLNSLKFLQYRSPPPPTLRRIESQPHEPFLQTQQYQCQPSSFFSLEVWLSALWVLSFKILGFNNSNLFSLLSQF